MSYILDTLKKLEKEKSEFENKLNLKGLIVKDDSAIDAVKSLKRRNYLLTFLAVVFTLFFAQNFYRDNYLNIKQNPSSEEKLIIQHLPQKTSLSFPAVNTEKQVKSVSTFTKGKKVNPGSMKLEIRNKTNSSGVEVIQKQDIIKKVAKAEPVYVDSNSNRQDNQRPGKKEDSAQKQNMPLAPNKPIDSTMENTSQINNIYDNTIAQGKLPQDILDIKINGIIFFGQKSSLNYALANFKGKDQVKLKAGDNLNNDVEVLEIQSEKIILIFNNKLFERSLGS